MKCELCPRKCGIDRSKAKGFCGEGDSLKVARAALHFGEEPCITGKKGSGTVFFSGCSLKCCFCQNYPISIENFGKEISVERLSDIFKELVESGAENINLVNPTHFADKIVKALEKAQLTVPIVYNTGGYERVETLKMFDGLVSIYLPDMKYMNGEIAKKYSSAENYFEYASNAVLEMARQVKIHFDGDKMERGLIVRHLVLPKCYHDSMDILRWLSENLTANSFLVSIMRQYTPCYNAKLYPEINRPLTTFEYEKVTDYAAELGLNGFTQKKESTGMEMTPDFDLTGV